jgi:uncharacterized MnhB-related membrane protein
MQPPRYPFESIIGVLFTALEAAEVAIDDVLLGKLIPTAPALFATVLHPWGQINMEFTVIQV